MNNVSGIFFGTVALAGSPDLTIPVVGISREDGLTIISQLPTTLTWTTEFADSILPTGGLISSFSAWGLSPDLTLKPDIAAPGGLIFSTLPLAQGGYGVISGTSMASPHVAGTAALLVQAQPLVSSQEVRDILQNSASPRPWFGNPASGLIESTHRAGAGMVDIDAAIRATTKVSPGKLSLGETQGASVIRTLTIENHGAADETYDLTTQSSVATGANTFTPSFFGSAAGVAFSANPVAVPAGGSASVDITFTEPAGLPNKGIFGGYIKMTPQGGGAAVRVPYSGFKGDYQSIVVLNPAASSFGNPLLRPSPSFGPSGAVTITKTATASILLHMDHQANRLRLEVLEAATGRNLGKLLDIRYMGRNATPTEFSLITWDGSSPRGGFLANGQYTIRLTVQKALAEDDNPAHVETWNSPVITVDRSGGGGEPQP